MRFAPLTGLKTRLRGRVDNAARGSDVPAGIERGADAVAPGGARERGRLRRRLRELRRLREAQLLELGALVLEAHKHGRDGSPVVDTKITEAAATDREVRAIADALDTAAGVDTIVVDGVAGPCPTCGTLVSTSARFCSTCATPLDGRPYAAPPTDAATAPETPRTDAREADAADAGAGDADAHHARAADAGAGDADAHHARAADAGAGDADGRHARAADPGAGDADTRAADAGDRRAAAAREPDADDANAHDLEARDTSEPDADARTAELRSANGHATKRDEVEATTGREP
jgi:hypothetical protein